MILSFRWYGKSDPVTLEHIAQIPNMRGIVTALHDVPVGDVWPLETIQATKEKIEQAGLVWNVVESLIIHDDVELGLPSRDRLIDDYCTSIANLGAAGVTIVCYHFMPVFSWMRTDLARRLPDGSTALSFSQTDLDRFNLESGPQQLPGWGDAYTPERFRELMHAFRAVDREQFWDHFAYFLERVIPVAAASGVKMAIHPSDPPWSIFGLPRIINDEADLERLVEISDHPANGITFCTGSFGANPANDLPNMIRRFADRIYFAHCRNVKITGDREFHEVAHPTMFGNVDMLEVMRAYRATGFTGPMRPDHGRMIWGEAGLPGYGLYDRALGAMYLQGLWDAIQ